jgi:hypothetical protein
MFRVLLHPSSGAQLQLSAIGVCNGSGMLIHWSRYWLGHPHTYSTEPDRAKSVYTQLTAQRYTTQAISRFGYQRGTHYCTPDDGHIGARNVLRQ